ncbi:VWA domain-containing protein [Bacillus sp. MMSF_3328]|uniref:VWA domain-containing protein n=1 Tax=Bacillus sp. MMSF_3328 TaxID=3047080 RepID=UPI00273F4229|nr:VWA domain-containing protein [Bacillus sp. MMSF_3328]
MMRKYSRAISAILMLQLLILMLSYTGKDILAAEEAGVDFSAKASQSVIVKPQNSNAEGSIDFHLTPKGKATNANRDPIDVVFVFDKSGSMNDSGRNPQKFQSAKDAMTAAVSFFKENAGPNDRFGFVPFDDGVETGKVVTFSPNNNIASLNLINSNSNSLSALGGTNYTQSLEAALGMFGNSTNNKYVLFMTDGEPTFSNVNEKVTYRSCSFLIWGCEYVTAMKEVHYELYGQKPNLSNSVYFYNGSQKTSISKSVNETVESIRAHGLGVAQKLAEKDIKLFSIGFGNNTEVDMNYLRSLSSVTGVAARQATQENIASIFRDISADMDTPSISGEIKVDLKKYSDKVSLVEGSGARIDENGFASIKFNLPYPINQTAPQPIDLNLPLSFKELGIYTFDNISMAYTDLNGRKITKPHSSVTIEVKADAPPGFKGTMNLNGSINTPDNLIKVSGSAEKTNEFEVHYSLNPFGLVNNTVKGSLTNLRIVQPLPEGVSLVSSAGAAAIDLPDGRKAIELSFTGSVGYSNGRFTPDLVTGAFKLKGDWALSNVKMPAAILYYKDSRFGNQQTTIAASSQVINMKVRLKDTTKQQAYDGDAAGIISKIDLSDNGKKLAQTGFPNDHGLLNKPIMDMRFTDNNKSIEVIYSDGSKATIYLVLDYEMTGVDTGKSYNSSEKANEHVNVKLTKLVAGQGVKYFYKIINEKGTTEWKEFSPDEEIPLTEPGENTIKIKAIGGFSATDQPVTKSLTIEKRIESINVSPDPIEVEIDKTAVYKVEILPAQATNKKLEISIVDNEIASLVGEDSVYGHKKGETELIVKTTDGSKLEKRVKIIVKDPYIALEEIKFKKAVYKLEINKKVNIESLLIFNPEKATKKKITEVFTADAKNGSVRVVQDGDDFYLEAAGIGYTTVTAVAEEQRDKSKPKASALFEVVNPDGSGNDGTGSGGRW